jgi:hypothetical protein
VDSSGPQVAFADAMKCLASFCLASCLLLGAAIPARAQIGYFGQNKVQYKSFKFQVLKTDHFDIYYYTEEEAAARMAGRMAERWYTRLSSVFTHELRGRFIEGMAEYLSIGPDDPHTAMWMREAIRRDRFPDIDHLDSPKYFPYRYGQALWAFIGGTYGDRMAGSLLRAGVGRDGYKGAFQRVLGVTSKDLSQRWREATAAAYRPIAEATKMPAAFARPLIVDATKKGALNVSPELSPDGSKIVSSRRAISSRSISTWPTRRAAASSARSPTPRPTRISTASSSSSRRAPGRATATGSCSPRLAAAIRS